MESVDTAVLFILSIGKLAFTGAVTLLGILLFVLVLAACVFIPISFGFWLKEWWNDIRD